MSQEKTGQEEADQNLSVNFSELILGFASAALYYTGDSSIEGKGEGEKNLQLAKHNIDIVRLLYNKTLGNLNEEEKSLIEEVLADLAHKYTTALKG
ncbi:MAG: DUF1844 domain-containing protein [Oligoflexales bacterium]|nr:DUF1844 domain-containing protein [Oligoflexales bacterium]